MLPLAEMTSTLHGCVVVGVKSFLRHVPTETSCRILVRTRGSLRHTWLQTSCRAHGHAIPDDVTHSPRSQVHRTRGAYTFQSSACELMDSQSPYPQSLDMSRELFQLVSERERERVVAILLKAFHTFRTVLKLCTRLMLAPLCQVRCMARSLLTQ